MSEVGTRGALSKNRNRLFAVGALLIAAIAFGVITFSGIGENLVYYWNPTQLHQAGNKAVGATIRLGGLVKEGTVVQKPGVAAMEFDVSDGKNQVHVRSNGVPPQMFREGIGVVVEGTMTKGGYFQCDRLMVKHGNDYRAPKSGEAVDTEKLIRSTEGLKDSK
jgi:cytochrome c-type biogenesis protein CcmE